MRFRPRWDSVSHHERNFMQDGTCFKELIIQFMSFLMIYHYLSNKDVFFCVNIRIIGENNQLDYTGSNNIIYVLSYRVRILQAYVSIIELDCRAHVLHN